ncbi:MAG: MSMEG_1061 family FMN-dependent PPOX-type flavoprotein [Marmoricola sp.]
MSAPWDDLPTVETAAELEDFGTPEPKVRDKVLDRLGEVHRQWVAASPLVLVATASPDGRCDVSPKGDPAGAVTVLDDTTLVIAERAGNRRMDGFHNILANPHVGLLFLIPGRGETMRVNGEARIVTDAPFFDDLVVRGHRPALGLMVRAEEVFFHCPKAFLRARAWQPETWRPDAMMPYAEIAKRLWRAGDPPQEVDAHYASGAYERGLYPHTAGNPEERVDVSP